MMGPRFLGTGFGGRAGFWVGDSTKVGFAGRGFSNFSGVGGLISGVVRLTEFRFFGPRARPLVRCVNCFPSSISSSTVALGSGADLLFTGRGRVGIPAIPPGGPLDNIVANAGLNRFTIESHQYLCQVGDTFGRASRFLRRSGKRF